MVQRSDGVYYHLRTTVYTRKRVADCVYTQQPGVAWTVSGRTHQALEMEAASREVTQEAGAGKGVRITFCSLFFCILVGGTELGRMCVSLSLVMGAEGGSRGGAGPGSGI